MVQAATKEDENATDVPSAMDTDISSVAPKKPDAEVVAFLLAANVALMEKNVKVKHAAASGRVLRTTSALRKRLTAAILRQFISVHLPSSAPLAAQLISVLGQVHSIWLSSNSFLTDRHHFCKL